MIKNGFIVEQCLGCERIIDQEIDGINFKLCAVYIAPIRWWNRAMCPFHPLARMITTEPTKKRVGQQKQRVK